MPPINPGQPDVVGTVRAGTPGVPGAGARPQAESPLGAGRSSHLLFEDELTVRYQIQEMLRIEKIFEEESIQGELEAYNPLVPKGSNFKATLLIEYPNAGERRRMLARLKGIEDRVWVQVDGCERVWATADEDLARENDAKTSAVHFLRFELTSAMKDRLKQGAALAVGTNHTDYAAEVPAIPQNLRQSLAADLS